MDSLYVVGAICLINIVLTVIVWVGLPRLDKNKSAQMNLFTPSALMKEIDNFIAENATRLILERLLADMKSETRRAFLEISDPKEPFFQGMVANIIASMSDSLLAQFHLVYKDTPDNNNIIIYTTHLIEMYSMILVNRVKLYEKMANDDNDKAVETGSGPIIDDIREYVNSMLIESVMTDMTSFSNIFDAVGKKKETK